MIRSCSMYAIRMNGVFNVPFMALDDNQACEIVEAAFSDSNFSGEFDLVKIGSFDFYDGVNCVDHQVVRTYCVTLDFPKEEQEVTADDVSETL